MGWHGPASYDSALSKREHSVEVLVKPFHNSLYYHLSSSKSPRSYHGQHHYCFIPYKIHFRITGELWNLIGSHGCDLFTNRTNFCPKSYLFLANKKATQNRTKQPMRLHGLSKVTNEIARKRKTKKLWCEEFETFVPKNFGFSIFLNKLFRFCYVENH